MSVEDMNSITVKVMLANEHGGVHYAKFVGEVEGCRVVGMHVMV